MNKEMTNVLTLKEIAGLANFATVGILAMADSTGEDLPEGISLNDLESLSLITRAAITKLDRIIAESLTPEESE